MRRWQAVGRLLASLRGAAHADEALHGSLIAQPLSPQPPWRAWHCWSAAAGNTERRALWKQPHERAPPKAASPKRPRLLGGDPLTKVRLARRKELGITDERGPEQDNTWKRLRKEKPPRGHPDRKPRHAGNPRRIPDLFRVDSWQQLDRLVAFHHDWLTWPKLAAFLARAQQLHRGMSPVARRGLRESGLLERLRDRAEELDVRFAEEEHVLRLSRGFRELEWDPGPATAQRLNTRLAELEQEKQDAEQRARELLSGRARAEQKWHAPRRARVPPSRRRRPRRP